jgi:acetoacetyl-CoA reductase
MSKVAVVTGGTRGIGHAISIELKNRGYSVVAIYGGNDEAAHKFQAETGIPIFKWDVGDYDACAAGLKQVETCSPSSMECATAASAGSSTFHP